MRWKEKKISTSIEQEGEVKNVSDTGSGIQNQFKIFWTWFYYKKTRLGIGFIVVKRIVEEYHNGTIKVLNSEIKRNNNAG
jgi:sensor histidine kinase regulating citrate/malate metabolism